MLLLLLLLLVLSLAVKFDPISFLTATLPRHVGGKPVIQEMGECLDSDVDFSDAVLFLIRRRHPDAEETVPELCWCESVELRDPIKKFPIECWIEGWKKYQAPDLAKQRSGENRPRSAIDDHRTQPDKRRRRRHRSILLKLHKCGIDFVLWWDECLCSNL